VPYVEHMLKFVYVCKKTEFFKKQRLYLIIQFTIRYAKYFFH